MSVFCSGKDAPMSICPSAGKTTVDTTTNAPYAWKLPPNTGDGSYTNLFLTKAGLVTGIDSDTDPTNKFTFVNTIQAEPYGFVLSGAYFSALGNQGRYGGFWVRSSYGSNSNYSRNFYFYSASDAQYPGGFGLQGAHSKYVGRAVRCVIPCQPIHLEISTNSSTPVKNYGIMIFIAQIVVFLAKTLSNSLPFSLFIQLTSVF